MHKQEYNNPNDKPTAMSTMSACMNKAVKEGFVDSFKVSSKGMYAPATDKYYKPEEVSVINFYRFEGESDPSENAILYTIQTADGVKGMLIDAYGAYSDVKVSDFMTHVENINKKVTGNNEPQTH